MKIIKTALCVFSLLIVSLLLAACGKKTIVGQWNHENGGYTYTFNEDGSGAYAYGENKMEFTYTVDGDKISILYKGNTSPFETSFILEDDTLNIKDSLGNDTIYKRK